MSADNERITHVPVEELQIPSERQRTKLSGIDELAQSIKRVGLLHPVIVRGANPCVLVAGERRVSAYKLLALQEPGCWDTIPARSLADLSQAEAELIELEENVKREALHWKDHCLGAKRVADLFMELHAKASTAEAAEHIGMTYSRLYELVSVAKALEENHERVHACSTTREALNVLSRERMRAQDNALNEIAEELGAMRGAEDESDHDADPGPENTSFPAGVGHAAAKPWPELTNHVHLPAAIRQANFGQWIETYEGKKFNLIHCDFPYGVGHDNSAQGGSATYGAYEDSPDVFWSLCKSLLDNRENIMYRSCHIMFWFSMGYYTEIIDFFAQHAPEINVCPFPLVWHKTDNKGIVPDVTRQPRRIYETAFLMTRGDRKLIQPLANTHGAPTNKANAIHVSEKPCPVLRHFFRMLVDENSRVLDPTAGSGTAIRVAADMGAEYALGLELDHEYAAAAQKQLTIEQNMRKASETIDGG